VRILRPFGLSKRVRTFPSTCFSRDAVKSRNAPPQYIRAIWIVEDLEISEALEDLQHHQRGGVSKTLSRRQRNWAMAWSW
jgi:hypothetical protein